MNNLYKISYIIKHAQSSHSSHHTQGIKCTLNHFPELLTLTKLVFAAIMLIFAQGSGRDQLLYELSLASSKIRFLCPTSSACLHTTSPAVTSFPCRLLHAQEPGNEPGYSCLCFNQLHAFLTFSISFSSSGQGQLNPFLVNIHYVYF